MTHAAIDAGLTQSRRATPLFSRFEFWPGWLFYAPVIVQWLALGARHGSLSLPTAANPRIETGGLCGESKSAILDQIAPGGRDMVAPYATFVTGEDDRSEARRAASGLGWPLVVKPDIGCNGTGVRLVAQPQDLDRAVAAFPRGVRLMVQAFIPGPGEAGVFYIRHPDEATGRVSSLTIKSTPTVVGDGRSSLRALVLAHPRAGRIPDLYLPRLRGRLDGVPPAGTILPLVFTGNHCKGAVFENGASSITPALVERIDGFARAIPDFHFGRIDVRYDGEAALRTGQGLRVIEVNGAGSEATHIWDARCTLRQAYAAQFEHYGAAWKIGRAMRARGHRPSGLLAMYRAWIRQRRLMASYPVSD